MTDAPAETAQRVASDLRIEGTWELFGQRLRRYEVYFDGAHVETIRGPILLEGVGLRVFRPRNGAMGVGFQATSDLTAAGLRTLVESAETIGKTSTFPAQHVELPSHASRISQGPEICSPALWEHPAEEIDAYVHGLLSPLEGLRDVRSSFGSVKATLAENSIVNSEGLSTTYVATEAEFEFAVKAFGGPEGPAPGEYWIAPEMRELDRSRLTESVERWAQRARDVRRAKAPESGVRPIALPPALLSEILPQALQVRFTGIGQLRKMALTEGARLAPESVQLTRDPTQAWSLGSAPIDDEGTRSAPVPLLEHGVVAGLTYDALHAAAFDRRSNGAAGRSSGFGPSGWFRFTQRPTVDLDPLTLAAGTSGTDAELIEGIEDGIWVDRLGWPNPDPLSGGFGGELRIGYEIRHGKLGDPVRGGTVGGLVFAAEGIPSLLGGVLRVGSRPELIGRMYTPALLVKGPTIAGTS